MIATLDDVFAMFLDCVRICLNHCYVNAYQSADNEATRGGSTRPAIVTGQIGWLNVGVAVYNPKGSVSGSVSNRFNITFDQLAAQATSVTSPGLLSDQSS